MLECRICLSKRIVFFISLQNFILLKYIEYAKFYTSIINLGRLSLNFQNVVIWVCVYEVGERHSLCSLRSLRSDPIRSDLDSPSNVTS